MLEHIALLKKEVDKLSIRLEQASMKPGVRIEEIANIEKKLRLKRETMEILLKMQESVEYAVYWKIHRSEYDPVSEWGRFSGWTEDLAQAKSFLKKAKENVRCAEAKIVVRSTEHWDFEERG